MDFNEEQLENLSDLLMSPDELNAKIALEIFEQNIFPVSLLSELFAFYKTTEDKVLKGRAKLLLEKYGSKELIAVLKKRLPIKGGKSTIAATEKTIKKNIIQYTHYNELDGVKIAKALYRKLGVGATYLLTATPVAQRKEVLKTFISGTEFKLNNKALTQFPAELFEFPELTSIDLSQNKITSIPKNIEVFTDLHTLNLSQNKLKSIHKNFLKLENLKVLDISKNNFTTKFPEIIFKLSNLQKLNIIQVLGNSAWYSEMPDGIYDLKKLEALELAALNMPVYPNYPSIRKVTGNPIDLTPLAAAIAAYEQGDKNSVYYILKHGNDAQTLSVLNDYYDSKTCTMDFQSLHIEEIPRAITQFKIKRLLMKNCGLGTYYGCYSLTPEVIERIRRRSLSRTAILSELPDVEVLDLSFNNLCEISDISNLKNLKELNLNRNKFGNFPLELTKLTGIERLHLSNNYPVYGSYKNVIAPDDLPEELKNLTSLKFLHLYIQGMSRNKQSFKDRLMSLLPNCEIVIQ